MISPSANDIGRPVLYRSAGGDKAEVGIIGKITTQFVFVRYAGQNHLVATKAEHLEWLDKQTGDPAGPHGEIENLARSIATEVLANTTIHPSAIAREVDRSWLSYVLLIEDEVFIAAMARDAQAGTFTF